MNNPNKLLLSVLILVAAMVLQGCGDDDAPAKTTVYAGGSRPSANDYWAASYFQDGEIIDLEDGTDAESNVYAITTYGKDVYMAGYNGSNAAYWKNGVLESIPLTENSNWNLAYGIVVNKQGVHVVVRTSTNGIVYLKNGVATSMNCQDCYTSWNGSGFKVINNDYYIGGYRSAIVNGNNIWQAGYWKNGTWNALLNPNSETSYAYGIEIVGNDVYVAGVYYREGWRPAIWKNGELSEVGTDRGWVYDMEIVKGDIYVAGYVSGDGGDRAAYWKNGVVEYLGDDTSNSYGYSIDVKNDKVYVIGEKYDANKGYLTALWSEGTLTAPFDGTQIQNFGSFQTLYVR